MNFKIANEMQSALNAYSLREKAIANNLANADTPGYKRKYVKFEEFLTDQNNLSLRGMKTNSRHFDIPAINSKYSSVMVTDNSVSTRLDGNNVNTDVESADMAKNYISYSTISQNLSAYYKSLVTAVTGGKK